MSSRQEQKAQARAARERSEAAAAAAARRKRRFGLLSAAVLVAAVVVAIAVAVSAGGGGGAPVAARGAPAAHAGQVAALLRGIPQHGNVLGDPGAQATLVEYGDLKCPVCDAWDKAVFPTIVKDYIRPGKLKMVYEPQAFVGEQLNPGDSHRAARFALAAGEQNRMWSVIALFYANQQDENTRYVTDAFLRRIGGGVAGLDVGRALQQMNSAQINQRLQASEQKFSANGFQGTPSFQLGGPGRRLTTLSYANVTDTGTFTHAIDKALGK